MRTPLLLLCVAVLACPAWAGIGRDDPAKTLATILDAPPGTVWIPTTHLAEAVERARSDPNTYLPLLAAATDAPDLARFNDAASADRYANAVRLLAAMWASDRAAANDKVTDLLAQRFRQLHRLLAAGRGPAATSLPAHRARAQAAANQILTSLGDLSYPGLAGEVAGDLARTDVATYNVFLEYLGKVAAGDARIAAVVQAQAAESGRENLAVTRGVLRILAQRPAGQIATAPAAEPETAPAARPRARPTQLRPPAGGHTDWVWPTALILLLVALAVLVGARKRKAPPPEAKDSQVRKP